MQAKTKPCPTCDGQYTVHNLDGAKPVHPKFPNVLIARSTSHWMFNVWIRGEDGKARWIDWVSERGLDSYVKGLEHAKRLSEIGEL